MISAKDKVHLLQLMFKYQLKVLTFEHGRAQIEIGTMEQYEDVISHILEDLQVEQLIESYHVTNNEIYIEFDEALVTNESNIKLLLSYVDKYRL